MPSSVVAAMEYNEPVSTLRITYVSGKVYDYKNVPPEVFEEMKEADSKGTFLNYRIKGKYRYKRVK
ncbi:KTSC domain-containing protein [Mucilaginibacter sp.]|uniref:KTSC domain-containing protein n=1 Tax=Mucilaginibacter sp. TaxID=1882438 RepID=UPI0025EBE96F|nr:KTSC domain-containing protein [Mucilaginibacter sp.]